MVPRREDRPALDEARVRAEVERRWGRSGELTPLPAEWDQNFRLDTPEGERFVVKIANRGTDRGVLELENAVLERLAGRTRPDLTPVPVLSRHAVTLEEIESEDGASYPMRLLTWIEGRPLAQARPLDARALEEFGARLAEIDVALDGFHHPGMERDLPWDLAQPEWISRHTHRIVDAERQRLVERTLVQYLGRVRPRLGQLPRGVIHNDANDENVLVRERADGGVEIAGIVDFGDLVHSSTINELAIAAAYASFGADDPLSVLETMALGYDGGRRLAEVEVKVLFPLVAMRLAVSLTSSAIAAAEDPDNAHRRISEEGAAASLARMAEIDWREAERRLRATLGMEAGLFEVSERDHLGLDELRAARRRRLGPNLSLAYDEPLEIVRGRGAWLIERDGRANLDCVNNVCHVGHCHPEVARALSEQSLCLNTNTRYLHPGVVKLAERLTATLPDELDTCFFVNSGSEANELALRLARTHTKRRDVIVLADAYHGNTQTLVDLSPYKCEGPGGAGLAAWAHKVTTPDPYRGPHRGRGPEVAAAYVEELRELALRLNSDGHSPAAFLCESIVGCGGQVVLPEGYLAAAFDTIRAVGGVAICDEVQVGMGRVGTHMWAFQPQGARPDIVTVGKPIGNGHPLAAVITTAEIAASFDTGMEYFNTFGGNPVSMAVGNAVLDVIERDNLMAHAERTGRYLVEGFARMAEADLRIGDIRGYGMFLGVELVRDRETLEPASAEAAFVVEEAKRDGILLSVEGPHHNVLKIKPPLAFGETEADLLLNSVQRALARFG